MHDYEKLGVFYLGRHYDLQSRSRLPDLLLYRSNDLLTHALCVGMTGSGKTGLCFDLIEEAAIDGIPAILIDPKGDLGNLLLTFPELKPEDFEPWVNPDDARKKGLSTSAHAAAQAEFWRTGLAQWNQEPARIARLRQAADFTIYTPGSSAGLPVSILNSFAAPPPAVIEDPELLRERVNTTVSGLLALLGIDAEPTRSREAIFLGNLLQQAWLNGRDLDLGALIHEIQTPSIPRIGVMDVETFYPAKDRFVLATAINGLLASPGFGAWLEGEPLDIQRILYTAESKPRVAIFSIAHLNDAERMFFVTLLLNQVLGWMRTQQGTTSLRALVYMDEIFGYFPPVQNPPSKLPLLTLLKQARAFGVGVVLATQNPVDLDYKGLANIGTWFLGRLQTDRDKQRVLEGLEGAAATQGAAFDRTAMESTLAALGNRIFLLHNVHEHEDILFESRWSMSYLRGPMTRQQIKVLTDARRPSTSSPIPEAPIPARVPVQHDTEPQAAVESLESATTGRIVSAAMATDGRPTLPPEVPQFFLPPRQTGAPLMYVPRLVGAAAVRFANAKAKLDVTQDLVLLTPIRDEAVPVDWADAEEVSIDPKDLERHPVEAATYAPLPAAASQGRNYSKWQKDLVNAIYGTRKITLLKSTQFNQVSRVDETEGDFRIRLQQSSREQRDLLTSKLRAKYAPKLATLQDRLRRAEQAVERETAQARQAKVSSVISFGSTLLGAFLGRKTLTATNVSKAGSALRSAGRAAEQIGDVDRAAQTVEAIRQQLTDLDAQFVEEVRAAEAGLESLSATLETVELRPSKSNITVKLVALVWAPHSKDAGGQCLPAF